MDLKEHVCPGGVCRPSVEGQILRPDGVHFRGVSAVVTGSWLIEQLLALPGVEPRADAGDPVRDARQDEPTRENRLAGSRSPR